jgi:hypothetical protein
MRNKAQMLLTTDDPDILAAQLALDEATEAANNSCV